MNLTMRSVELIAEVGEVLARPRNECRFCLPDELPLTSPNGELLGRLVWDIAQSTYRLVFDV